ncbi:hypothetical protein SAMN07250955_11953 [Arboricoccus pini]|uniref:Uncharacterized protein n=1 Tax=Arboricoccus pini TaxID=1963835 RepID=A0A212S1G8_9PROT|nr:hypothetical protein [Arboricoccus pini]SNB78834.1 hypothetical protein SAMN07250955_11953 [Arboricoccus pini]
MINLTLRSVEPESQQAVKGIPVWLGLGGAFAASAVLWTVGWLSLASLAAK